MILFNKFHGTGNDFILIDNRSGVIDTNKLSTEKVKFLCTRHTGIGADGLILLEQENNFDFKMVYFNSDGQESTMCGNGGRCLVAFAAKLGVIKDKARFVAIDGEHIATVLSEQIALQMIDVMKINAHETFYQVNTGSPHYVTFVDDVDYINVPQEGAMIRNSPMFKEEGINVNFVQEKNDNTLIVRTYERGVEDETLSCGTGVTAAALTQMQRKNIEHINIETLGGSLSVEAKKTGDGFSDIWLKGPAIFVFEGTVKL